VSLTKTLHHKPFTINGMEKHDENGV